MSAEVGRIRGRVSGMSAQELVDAIEPLLNSIAMEFGHDPGCRLQSGFPEARAKGCNCSRMEAEEALHALRELRRRAEA